MELTFETAKKELHDLAATFEKDKYGNIINHAAFEKEIIQKYKIGQEEIGMIIMLTEYLNAAVSTITSFQGDNKETLRKIISELLDAD